MITAAIDFKEEIKSDMIFKLVNEKALKLANNYC